MKIVSEFLPGTFLLEPARFDDLRGHFIKTYHESDWKVLGLPFKMEEEFFSVSRKNVIRGMHFQIPPHDHEKVVYCMAGSVLDVLLDLRPGSGFGRIASTVLSMENRNILYIPKGIAHGFLALEDETLMMYKTSTMHSPQYDRGIRWDSFGYEWGIDAPIISARDENHPSFSDFNLSIFAK